MVRAATWLSRGAAEIRDAFTAGRFYRRALLPQDAITRRRGAAEDERQRAEGGKPDAEVIPSGGPHALRSE